MREGNVAFTETDFKILNSYKSVLDGLAAYWGDGYEMVLHSLHDLDHSVIKIINGHYTGRREGFPITDLALSMLAKIREQPDTGADVVTQVAEGEELQVAELYNDQWVKVFLDDEEVFVSRDYVELKSDLQTAITMTELLYGQGVSDVRVDLCQYAKQFLGNPYVWGGTSLTSGADCSGFVLSVFNKYGVTLPHSSQAQSKMGSTISASELKAGDLIFYAKGGSINHVAIYIGGGQIVHAANSRSGIIISNAYYQTPVCARRYC